MHADDLDIICKYVEKRNTKTVNSNLNFSKIKESETITLLFNLPY